MGKLSMRFYMGRLVISFKQNGVAFTVKKIIRKLIGRMSTPPRFPFRTRRFSSKENHSGYQNALKETSNKKLTLISMVKNERSIIETFCGHAICLFDRIILIDHKSTDGTKEYLEELAKKYPKVEYFLFDEQGYYQSQLMTWIVRKVIDREIPGWVFFLDADEFLPFESRDELNHTLAKFNAFPVISMPWLNLVPLNMESGRVIGEKFLKSDRYAAHCKIAFQPNLIPLDDYVVAQGNHALLVGAAYSEMFPAEESFPIYHLPIRTKAQLREKILQGIESYRSMGKNRAAGQGVHWDEINIIMGRHGLSDELMAGMIVRYGEPMKSPYVKSLRELMQEGYTVTQLNICHSMPLIDFDSVFLSPESKASCAQSRVGNVQVGLNGWTRIELDHETHVLHFK